MISGANERREDVRIRNVEKYLRQDHLMRKSFVLKVVLQK